MKLFIYIFFFSQISISHSVRVFPIRSPAAQEKEVRGRNSREMDVSFITLYEVFCVGHFSAVLQGRNKNLLEEAIKQTEKTITESHTICL